MDIPTNIIANIFDSPNYCSDWESSCNYLSQGRCVLRIVNPEFDSMEKFLELASAVSTDFYLKDPSCKFIWEKFKK